MVLLALLGLLAGVLTTIAGMGGGLFLLMALGLVYGPHVALAVTTPALLVSNLHRGWLFRADVQWPLVKLIAMGVIPGAILGALVLPGLPDWVVAALFTASTVFALLRSTGRVKFDPKPRWITAYSFAIGGLAATSGGAGMLIAPLILASGATGSRYVATVAFGAVAMHAARVIGYGSVGILVPAHLVDAAVILCGLLLGNVVGRRLRGRIGAATERRVELGALLVANAFAIAAVVRGA
jgi:uncharacterized membrane protein YfcA